MTEKFKDGEFAAVRSFLETHEGCRFLYSADFVEPEFDEDYICQIFGQNRLQRTLKTLHYLTDFLRGQPIVDKFGRDHSQRREWRCRMVQIVGKHNFQNVYEKPNQLRANNISIVSANLVLLRNDAKDENVRSQLNQVLEGIRVLYKSSDSDFTGEGILYSDMTIQDKLYVVDHICYYSQEVIRMFVK
ncbi:hypothetical protein A2154_04715 [Candidatus Gottesmanbacteria bacterium RBG_16_43_7]|uniref:Uncharacterized protein n=1 Tax=Candidatus Gottesmanbacteria bacterium RBG_16_43_7 TaxID=1798373 RepID=A0A1F5Z7M6_9BACT|nr:MAG: hypothetical protein A2154_04715 [Candidatus Gottesmanbacteria bacterium RBG_16_43_7]